MSDMYGLNAFMAQPSRGHRPPELVDAQIKTPHVISAHIRRNTKLHRPATAYTYRECGRLHLAVRYACGAGTTSAMPVPALDQFEACGRCEEITSRPADWAVYAFFDASGQALYVGQTENLTTRRLQHIKQAPWWAAVTDERVLAYATTRREALEIEAGAIRFHAPLYNVIHNGKQVAS